MAISAKQLRRLDNARQGATPSQFSPELATLVDEVPQGDEWSFEPKYDGYRLLCRIQKGEARLLTRNGKDWTERFSDLAARLDFDTDDALVDGELIHVQHNRYGEFQDLQNAMQENSAEHLVYCVFDLPFCQGYDLREVPLEQRRDALQKMIGDKNKSHHLTLTPHFQGNGEQRLRDACREGMEGILAKRTDSPYRSTRNRNWLKIKCESSQELVICGYTDPEGSRIGFGALLLGYYDDDELVYAGRVGTGFDDETLRSLHKKLSSLERKTSPYDVGDPDRKGVHWVTPKLVGEVAFTEWTEDGRLRHPAFLGLREDKPANKVVREKPG